MCVWRVFFVVVFFSKSCIFVILMFSVSLYNCVLQTGPATKWLCTGARSNVQVSCKLFKWTNVVECTRHSGVCNLHLSPSRDITNLLDIGRSQISCLTHPEAVSSNLEYRNLHEAQELSRMLWINWLFGSDEVNFSLAGYCRSPCHAGAPGTYPTLGASRTNTHTNLERTHT